MYYVASQPIAANEEAVQAIYTELRKIEDEFKLIRQSLQLDRLYAYPKKTFDHMIVDFDVSVTGTAGLHQLIGSTWVKL